MVLIEQLFEHIKYGIYPQNADFYDAPIEYKKRLFTQQTIYCLTDNKLERLKVSLTKWSLDNRRHKSNHQNDDFYDLPFDGDEMMIARQLLYCINDIIIFS